MTDKAKRTLRGSLLLLLAAVSAGYLLLALSSPVSSHAQAFVAGKLDEEKFFDPNLLRTFYQERDLRPVWLRGPSRFQPRAQGVLKVLENSWSHGLNPEQYHVSRLKELAVNDTEMNRYEFDLLMTDAVIRYARDLTGMRGQHSPNARDLKYWREPMGSNVILEKVVKSNDPVGRLYEMEPTGKLYQALRRELVSLAAQANDPHDRIKIGSTLKPGQENKAVPLLREHFGFSENGSNLYDDELAARVMTLQRQSGQKADGVIRAETLAAINRSPEEKMMQVLANMERLRWIGQGRPDRYVLVNIPSASLWAVENGSVALEMPVIVGKTARPTYSFKTEISGVRFNPNWTVPPTIKKADFLPALQQDPTTLVRKGIRVMHNGKEIDSTQVDWSKVSSKGLSNLRMVQSPGDNNPLGKVRVIMENPYNIYLHDTNHREMFEKDERTLSSGCVRVSQPEKLADFILKKNEGWTWNGMQKLIDSGRMRDIPAEEKIPVYITYQTIWLDSEGSLIYGADVYGQDEKLSGILKKAGGIHIPQASEIPQISL